jgi:DNA-binding transcriptional regulator YiaG
MGRRRSHQTPQAGKDQHRPAANLIGERVRWVREKLQLTQDQLAVAWPSTVCIWTTSRLAR